MSIQVTSRGDAFKIVQDGLVKTVPKDDVTFSSNGNRVMISLDGEPFVDEDFSEFTDPSGGSAGAVRQQLEDLRESGQTSTTGTPSQLAFGAMDPEVQALAANPNRVTALFFNNTDIDVCLVLGTTAASADDFTVKLATQEFYEVTPYRYTGEIRVFSTGGGSGNLNITELT